MSPKTNSPTLEQWARLYELMAKIKDLAPWEYMHEDDLFGIRFPETGQLGFVSVMGNLGEHLSIATYLGSKGFEGFWNMQRAGSNFSPDLLLQTPQLQASLEDREILTPEDRKIIKQLNLKYRGRQAWPQFRSFRPGCFPWYLEKKEAQTLITGLEQLLEVAPRFKNDPESLETLQQDENFLVRVFQNGQWVDQYQIIEFPDDAPIKLLMNMEALAHLKTMPKQNSIVEIDVQMMEEAVKDKQFDRPFFPYLLLAAERKNRMILGVNLLTPLPSLEEMWGELPAQVVEILAASLLPEEVQTKNRMVALMLSSLEKDLGIKVKLVSHLPAIEFAQRELNRFSRF
jgi:hypothetical protein